MSVFDLCWCRKLWFTIGFWWVLGFEISGHHLDLHVVRSPLSPHYSTFLLDSWLWTDRFADSTSCDIPFVWGTMGYLCADVCSIFSCNWAKECCGTTAINPPWLGMVQKPFIKNEIGGMVYGAGFIMKWFSSFHIIKVIYNLSCRICSPMDTTVKAVKSHSCEFFGHAFPHNQCPP